MLEDAGEEAGDRALGDEPGEMGHAHCPQGPVGAGEELLQDAAPQPHDEAGESNPEPREVPVALDHEREEDRSAAGTDLALTLEDHGVALIDRRVGGGLVAPDEAGDG